MRTFSVAFLAAANLWPSAAGAATRCSQIQSVRIAGVTMTKAEAHPAGVFPAETEATPIPHPAFSLPAYCRVDGVIDPRTGTDGKRYGIRFALALPTDWNGRFLFQGGGGTNGFVGAPLGFSRTGHADLARGYAVVTTDTGHEQQGPGADMSFLADQQAALDFGYVAIGRVADLAKQLITRYYGRPPAHSYFSGCSEGGREGMVMAERYPTYFDGIVAGAPFMTGEYQTVALGFVADTLNRRIVDASGRSTFAPLFSDSDRTLVVSSILNQCDADDGLKDGLIFNTRACKFDPATLACGSKSGQCLNPEQVRALQKVLAGPKDSSGHPVYPGYPPDGGMNAPVFPGVGGGILEARNRFGVADPANALDVDKAAANAAISALTVLTSTDHLTNLNTFRGHGGKLLFLHGMGDPLISPLTTIDYYERMSRDNGGKQKAIEFSRLFLVPGLGHCGGGVGLDDFDPLQAVVDWVETGKAPDRMIATGGAFPGRTRPLCAYPKYAHYTGSGDSEKAESFECRD